VNQISDYDHHKPDEDWDRANPMTTAERKQIYLDEAHRQLGKDNARGVYNALMALRVIELEESMARLNKRLAKKWARALTPSE